MANDILTVPVSTALFSITLASLANGNARQSTMLVNSGNYPAAVIYIEIESSGSAPTAGSAYKVYLLRGSDGTGTPAYRTDGAGASDAALTTVLNANLLGVIRAEASVNTKFYGDFDTAVLGPLGPEWGIAIVNNSGQALNSTEGNHYKGYAYYRPQVQ